MKEIEATQIIESDQPLIGLMGQFGSGLDALRFYAGKMTYRFCKEAVGAQCCYCERKSVSRVQVFCWRAFVNPRFAFTRTDALLLLAGRVGITLQHTVVDFATFHGFCESCASNAKRNRFISVLVKSISFFLLLVCMGIVVLEGGAAIIFWSDPKERQEGLIVFFAGTIGLIASVFGHIWERKLRIPKFARTIGRKPFFLACLWALGCGAAANTLHKHIRAEKFYFVLEGTGRPRGAMRSALWRPRPTGTARAGTLLGAFSKKLQPFGASGSFGFWLRFRSVAGRFGHAPSLSPAKTPKSLAAERLHFFSNALIQKR